MNCNSDWRREQVAALLKYLDEAAATHQAHGRLEAAAELHRYQTALVDHLRILGNTVRAARETLRAIEAGRAHASGKAVA